MGLDLIDIPIANIKQHFDAAAEFIRSAVTTNGTVRHHYFKVYFIWRVYINYNCFHVLLLLTSIIVVHVII